MLECIDGPRLSSLIRKHGPLQQQQYLPLALDIASALHYFRHLRYVVATAVVGADVGAVVVTAVVVAVIVVGLRVRHVVLAVVRVPVVLDAGVLLAVRPAGVAAVLDDDGLTRGRVAGGRCQRPDDVRRHRQREARPRSIFSSGLMAPTILSHRGPAVRAG